MADDRDLERVLDEIKYLREDLRDLSSAIRENSKIQAATATALDFIKHAISKLASVGQTASFFKNLFQGGVGGGGYQGGPGRKR